MTIAVHPLDAAFAMSDPTAHFQQYAQRLSSLMAAMDWAPVVTLARDLADCTTSRRQVFICGNGGSAANGVHLANDFLYGIAKKPGSALRATSLSANSAVISCLANDLGYDRVYEVQLAELASRGDLLIVLSGSGNSPNILKALQQAERMGVTSYAILGYDGGAAKALADVPIHFPLEDMQIAEDMQLIVGHMMMQWMWDNREVMAKGSA